jgi:hypothetical protein
MALGGIYLNKRGRKPVEIGILNSWEYEWNKALHLLRDGVQSPSPRWVDPDLAGLTPQKIDAGIRLLKQTEPQEVVAIWEQRQGKLLKPTETYLRFAEDFIGERIATLEQLKPRKIHARAERQAIWDALIRARKGEAVRRACEQWEHLADVRAAGMGIYPAYVVSNADAFLAMKRNRRFPRSAYAADSRLEYLARGMAGIMVGVSPMTAIERIRNMKHTASGPLWSDSEKVCGCWRCETARSKEAMKALGAVEFPQSGAHQQ